VMTVTSSSDVRTVALLSPLAKKDISKNL